MIGAGVFAAFAPAAQAAAAGLLVGLAVAAVVAYANAFSSAQLAAIYPQSGGTYVYGRERLGRFWGFLAGWGFVVGKIASCAAMALTFGFYAVPSLARPLAIAAVVALVAVNYFGVEKTAKTTRAIVTRRRAASTGPWTASRWRSSRRRRPPATRTRRRISLACQATTMRFLLDPSQMGVNDLEERKRT